MGRRCCITGCSSRSSAPEHHGVTYHSFPLDANIRGIWVKNTRLQSDRNITKSVLVCSRHFRRADFQPMKSGKYLLKQRVFPTVFPWGKIDHNAATNMEATGGSETSDIPANDSSATATPNKTIIPTGLTTPTANTATTATVEATIAQIMAETAELNAAAGIKKTAVPDVGEVTTSLEKRQAPETYSSSDESPKKQPRSTVETTPVLPIAANVSPATRFEAISVFNPGARLEAQDFDGAWHSARVVEVDNDDREVLIKFEKSGKQHKGATLGIEEWIPMNSTRLRQKVSTKPILIFDLEEKVMARWTGARRFPATIKKILSNDMYEVLFDDGFVKNVRSLHMSKILPTATIAAVVAPSTTLATTIVTAPSTATVVGTPNPSATSKPKKLPVATESSATKVKRAPPGQRRDWPLLSLDKLDIASLNLPEIPKDGEWTCHWVNDQPIGKEGFLIVGEHKKPTVVVEDWRLPPGWVKHMYQRSNVLGKWDVILVTPNGKRFRSKADLKTYLEEQGQVYNPDIYDFSIHRRRAKDINAYAFTSGYSPQQPKKNPTLADTEIIKSVDIKLPTTRVDKATAATTAAVLASTSSNFIEAPIVTLIPPMELMTPPASTSTKQSPTNNVVDIAASSTSVAPSSPITAATTDDGFALIGGLKVQIVDNLFRCPQEGCAKNFRKENHLQIHVKHYHPDLIKLLGDCPKMQELAEKRTLGTTDSNEPLPKNQIPNQEFFAKLHQQDLEQSRSHRRSLGVTALAALATGTTEEATDDATVKVELTQSPIATSAHITASDTPEIEIQIKGPSGSKDNTVTLNATTDLSTVNNTTADSSLFELSVVSSTNDESAAELPVTATAVMHSKRSRFSPSKRTPGSRKSNRQRTTRRYLTAAQATAGAPLPPVITADSGAGGTFGAGDFEETRHSFNATPDAKHAEGTVIAISAKRRKAIAAPTTPLSSLDSPVTADSGSSLFQTLADDPNGSTIAIAAPQYIKENGELIKIVRMRQEEIINCLCSYGEEDGLMIQCELCLCWQHGICNGIDKESDVPDKYVCYICRNPQRGRECMRYKHDQDWLYEGKLPVASYHNPNPEHMTRFELLKKSHTLTGNLVELKRFMHSLRVKINIANNKGHPKMYLWAKKWDEEQKTEIKSEQRPEPIKIESNSDSQQTKSAPQNNTIDSKESCSGSATSSPAKRIKLEPPSTPDHAAAPAAPPLPLVPNIPQPEAAIEPVECQNRLLDHIKIQQFHVMERLSNIEAEIDELEKMDTLPDLKNADLSTTKDVLSTFIKELEIMKQISKINALENLKQSMNDNSVVIK